MGKRKNKECTMQVFAKCFNIKVDGSSWITDGGPIVGPIQAMLHETWVLQILDTISTTWSGYEYLTQVYNRGIQFNKDMTIVPYNLADRSGPLGPINAYAWFKPGEKFTDMTSAGQAIFGGGADNPATPQDERMQIVGTGTGGGTDIEVHFSPELFATSTGPASLPDDILLHEMVHGLREMQGEFDQVPTGPQDLNYDNDEEFLAIVMSNIYVSEKNGPLAVLRKDHHGSQPLPDKESSSDGFLLNNLENLFWIKVLYPQEMAYFLAVAANPMATFNPIREYMIYQQFYDRVVGTATYTVIPGDTLSGIGQKLYGDPEMWDVIYIMNSDVIGPNPNLIFPGQVLTVPLLA
jgi:nucleoid-associated protein YgaU